MIDSIKFWLAREIVEFLVAMGLFALILAVLVGRVFWDEWRARRRRRNHAAS